MAETVRLCEDLVVVHHCEMVEIKRGGVEEVEKAEDQAMTSEDETWCARMTKQLF